MDKATFIAKAKEICLESFNAYFVENDFPKSCKDMPSDRFKSFCIDKLRACVNYEDFMDYLMPTDCYERSAIAENIKLEVPFATPELCVVFLSADINFLIDNGYMLQIHARTSYVVTQRLDKLEILHLHFAIPHKTVRNMQLHRDGQLSSESFPTPNAYVCKGAATAAGLYSPNGLIFYQISGKEQINFVNNSLLKLLGYASNEELFEYTQGQLQKIVLPQDWPKIQAKLAERRPGAAFNMNASFIRKGGSQVKVLLRGNYVKTHNRFYVLSLTPLLVPQSELSYGDFSVENTYTANYSISYELFLKIGLDIFIQYGRENGIPYLLELCATLLNASNAWIVDVRNPKAIADVIYNYTAPGFNTIYPVVMTAQEALYYCHKFRTISFDSLEKTPEPFRSFARERNLHSWMYEIINTKGKESFIIRFFRQQEAPPWTTNEKKIMHYVSKMFALTFDAYDDRHPALQETGGV